MKREDSRRCQDIEYYKKKLVNKPNVEEINTI